MKNLGIISWRIGLTGIYQTKTNFDQLINVNNCTDMAASLEYPTKVSGIRYSWNNDVITRSKNEDKVQAIAQAEMVLDYKALK